MSRSPTALLLLAVWLAAIVGAGVFTQRHLEVSSDLRLFLPAPETAEQRLVMEGIGEGPAARVLVIALEGASPERLAEASRALVEALRDDDAFVLVANGEIDADAFPEALLAYRYLLSSTLDTRRFDADFLAAALDARVQDLSSPAGLFIEPLLPRDPTLELLNVLERWGSAQEPRREFDVWFDAGGERALLMAETRAPAFDPAGQRAALAKLQAALESVGDADIRMTATGAGRFSVLMEERTRAEARQLGLAATVGMIVLLLAAYRSAGAVVLSVLPLTSAGLAGLAAVAALFGSVHGITLAFGFTLVGVAQDYPLHLLSHRQPNRSSREVARALWPTLATGVAGTCIAYLTFAFSGVTGLQQLACFSVTGLVVAALASRFVLPAMVAAPRADHVQSPALARLWDRMTALPRRLWISAAVAAACAAVLVAAPQPFWEDSVSGLTPVPADLLEADRELRGQLGAADLRYMLVVDAADDDSALERLEMLDQDLQRLVERGAIERFEHAARYLPSEAAQRRRQSRLPDADSLRAALDAANAATPFREDVFEPFVADVATARSLTPLTIEQLRKAGVGARVDSLLRPSGSRRVALVTLSGVSDVDALRALAAATGVSLLDVREASESLVARQRSGILTSLGLAVALLVGVVALALRSYRRVLRVLAPMAITTLVVVAVLSATGSSLTLFHLTSLMLVAGLGLDYALFFEHAANDREQQIRTLHAVLTCAVSTFMVFALLAASTLPVLRAIGLPVAIGVVSNFVLSMFLAAPRSSYARPFTDPPISPAR
jgi:predicted exporter